MERALVGIEDILQGATVPDSLVSAMEGLQAGLTGSQTMGIGSASNTVVFNQTFNLEQSIDRILREFETEIRRSNYGTYFNG